MKTSRKYLLLGLVLGITCTAAWWSAAQTKAPDAKPITGKRNLVIDQLAALVSNLEANHQTNALKLFHDYSNASIALQQSADMGIRLHVLMALREGRTNDAISLLEIGLDGNIAGFAASYRELPKPLQEWMGLHSLSEAQWYRGKFPRKDNEYGSITNAFKLLNQEPAK